MRPHVLLLLPAPALAGDVTLSFDRWVELQPDAPWVEDGPGPAVLSRDVVVQVGDERASFVAVWTVRAEDEAWFAAVVAGPDVLPESGTWDGREAKLHAVREGYGIFERIAPGDTTFVLRGTVPAPGSLGFDLLEAPRGTVEVDAGSLVARVRGAARGSDGRLWTGAGRLEIVLDAPPTFDEHVFSSEIGVGLTIADDVATGRAAIRILPRRGAVESLRLDTHGLGADLRVEGDAVLSSERRGDAVEIVLHGPARDEVEVRLAWTQPLPAGDEAESALPAITVAGALSSRTFLRVARDSDREVVPDLHGFAGRAWEELPDWTDELVAGTPVAAWEATGPARGTLSLLRFVPVAAPDIVVDIADITLAASEDGRVLLRARYEVRNERAAFLLLDPPDGASLLALTVEDEPVQPSRGQGDALRIPLKRSVETIDGLLTFPVEIVLLFEDAPWTRARRAVPMPRVDAEIAVLRATLVLPPRYRAKRGGAFRVGGFDRGNDLLFAFGTTTEDREKSDQARSLFGDAVQAWKDNDFRSARDAIDDLKNLGGDNENVRRLEANLDALDAPARSTVATRRIVDQAKARSAKDYAAYESARNFAEQRARVGDWEAAAEATEEALELGTKLGQLEQDESVEVERKQEALAGLLEKAKEKKPAASPAPPPAADKFGFGEDEVLLDGVSGYGMGGGGAGYGSIALEGRVAKPVEASFVAQPIPRLGREVLFQRLLLPPGVDPGLSVRATAGRILKRG